jgi:hypothetical protein
MLRLYSYLYHMVLALFLLGLSAVALISSNQLRMPMLPWSGESLNYWLLWGSLLGLLSIVLAITGIFRYLFPLWCLTVLVLMVRGYILTPYPFAGKDPFYQALWLMAGAFLAFLASLTLFRIRRKRA